MTDSRIYEDIALRTNGDIYIGVVGPVRTGKSTFIKRFMESLVIPRIENMYVRERAKDELPQSGSGKTVMTAEPKFVPEEAVSFSLSEGVAMSVRLIDCVGYMVPGAVGMYEGESERMVTTPWFDHEITMTEAAEYGTRRVIKDHSTIGLVVTTDGSICDIPREDYAAAEERAIAELREIGKPFVLLLNCADPDAPASESLAAELSEKFGVSCLRVNCQQLDENDIRELMRTILHEFPLGRLEVFLPSWVDALPAENEIKATLFASIAQAAAGTRKLRDAGGFAKELSESEMVEYSRVTRMQMGSGAVTVEVGLPGQLYYSTISAQSGFEIRDDGDLMSLLTEMSGLKGEYERVRDALRDVRETGYGIVMPSPEEMKLEEPQIVSRSGHYSIRLKATAPSIHMMRVDIESEITPALGGEKASEEILGFLLQGFDGDASRLWESNIFGKTLDEIAAEGLTSKLTGMPIDIQIKLRDTLRRLVNDGRGRFICIVF